MSARLIIARHGQTDWNKAHRYLGHSDIDINDTGRAQIIEARARIAGEKVTRVYSSDLKRAFNSAALLFPGQDIETTARLREMDFGIFEGLSYEQIKMQHKGIYDAWIADPGLNPIPQGESLHAFQARVLGQLNDVITDNQGSTTAMVTHGGVVRMILCHVLEVKRFWDVKMVKPASVVIIDAQDNGQYKVERMEVDGDVLSKEEQ